MKSESLQTKLLVPVVFFVFFSVCLSATGLSFYQKKFFYDKTRKDILIENTLIKDAVELSMLGGNRARIQELLVRLGELDTRRIRVVSTSGIVYFSSKPSDVGQKLSRHEKDLCLTAASPGLSRNYSFSSDKAVSCYTLPNHKACQNCHSKNAKIRGVLVSELSLTPLHSMLAQARLRLIATHGALLILLITFLSVLLQKHVNAPVQKLLRATLQIGAGYFDIKTGVKSDDEIGKLGQAVDAMASKLRGFEEEIKHKSIYITELAALKKQVETANQQLREKVVELFTLYELGKAVSATLELEDLFNVIVEKIAAELKVNDFAIFLLNEETGVLELKASYGLPKNVTIQFHKSEGISGKVAETGIARIIPDVLMDPDFKFYHGIRKDVRSFVCMPLKIGSRVHGVLNIHNTEPNAYNKEDIALFEAVANQIAIAVENAKLYEQTRELADLDPLTGLYNHGYLQKRLHEEILKAKHDNTPFSFVILDIDNFKKVNDLYGHIAGDHVLRDIALLLRNALRKTDCVARYGGDEFALILHGTTKEEARTKAEDLRKHIEASEFFAEDEIIRVPLSSSFGVASFPDDGMDKKVLVEKADKAMYMAKEAGKNCVVTG